MRDSFTRREALKTAGAGAAGMAGLSAIDGLLAAAAGARSRHTSPADIEHVVILIQENRSFDHYFGTLSGVRGYSDPKALKGVFAQKGIDGKIGRPFHLPPGGCVADITHNWGPQHLSWNNGRMNRFLSVHETDDKVGTAGLNSGPETMGYHTRQDTPFYHGLADAFTICDGYHCSVLGPTDPNRLMSLSATVDPAGHHGGPLLHTKVAGRQGGFSWTTMPEMLQRKGVSWKQYTDPGAGILDNVLTYFDQYTKGTALYNRAIAPTYDDFLADLSAKKLPQVSWLLLGIGESEHPEFSSPRAGEIGAQKVVEALLAHPDIWRKTALFITWDENGGFFDHVPPPTAPAGTPGEYITVSNLPADAEGIRGPIGLGYRVPMLVVSPFSRGGLVCSRTFDHTSTLRFLETRFGATVPNLSRWRRKTTGDMMGAFNFAATANATRPRLPGPLAAEDCNGKYPPIGYTAGAVPKQEKGRRRRPSGIVK